MKCHSQNTINFFMYVHFRRFIMLQQATPKCLPWVLPKKFAFLVFLREKFSFQKLNAIVHREGALERFHKKSGGRSLKSYCTKSERWPHQIAQFWENCFFFVKVWKLKHCICMNTGLRISVNDLCQETQLHTVKNHLCFGIVLNIRVILTC